ncbi:EF-hand_domain [Hexamita inflata]|uniref:EF-hand domain n=1 Tax=Hexamita inflata TaxID=28002 RepID=A0AA86R8L6_9EUKA|nr:EF-hand domain [Hexamita inflata]
MKYTKQDYEDWWYKYNQNHDKGVFNGELYLFLVEMKLDPERARVNKYMKQFDKNGDGKLEVDEWCELMAYIFANHIQ